MKKQLRLLMLTLLCAVFSTAWGQSDYSTTYTSGDGLLSTTGGTNVSTCKVIINEIEYDGIKGGKTSAWKVTVPEGTKYLHLHLAGWNGENVTLTVTPNYPYLTTSSSTNYTIGLTENSGIHDNSPFTFSGDPSTSSYYKVITFKNALTGGDKEFTFTSTTGKRFVVFGVNAEAEQATTTYNVIYNLNGGTGNIENQTGVAPGTQITLAAAPTKTGYTFIGWSDGTNTHQAGASYTVNSSVTFTAQWTESTTPQPSGVIFYESFNTNDGKGGNDGSWSGSIATNAIDFDNEGWDSEKGNGAKECAKFGTGSAAGSATTPSIHAMGDVKLSFRAGAWNGSSEKTTLSLSSSKGTISSNSVTLVKGAFTDYEVTITGLHNEYFTITFSAPYSSNNRFFLDEVRVSYVEDPINVTISNKGYATLYYGQKSLVVPEGVTAYAVKVNGSNLNYTDVGNVIPAGTGVVLKGSQGEKLFYVTTTNNTVTDNDLLGYDENHVTEKPAGAAATDNYLFYMLSGGINGVGFYFATKDANGNDLSLENQNGGPFECLAHKAYLAVLNNGQAPSSFTFEDQTDINTVKTEVRGPEGVYTVTGVRMNSKNLPAGLYIVNGKKVIIK